MDNDKTKNDFSMVVDELKNCQDVMQKRGKLLELGFEFVEDEESENVSEILEEQSSKPETNRQRELALFFEGSDEPSLQILECFIAEKYSEDTNYPLIRRYFRSSNAQLKKLILYGLNQDPLNVGLLNDLSFFNEFKMDLKELIQLYRFACRESQDIVAFKALAKDFYESTQPYDYDAFYELIHDGAISLEKKDTIEELKDAYKEWEKSIIF